MFTKVGRRPTVVPSTVTPAATGPQSVPPSRFEAVAETLASGEDPHGVCSVVGRMLGADGASLEDALGGLRATWLEVRGSDPSFDATSALLAAWSDETLAYVHQLSCADPMTGLSSLVHVRSRLTELYLRSDRVHDDWAMVVCELPLPPVPAADGSDGAYRLVHSMRLARAGQCVRTVFVLGETVGRVGSRRVAALVERDGRLGDRVRLLRRLLEDVVDHTPTARVWIEGLPVDDVNAALLLDDLAR